jgi:hypothetical protein
MVGEVAGTTKVILIVVKKRVLGTLSGGSSYSLYSRLGLEGQLRSVTNYNVVFTLRTITCLFYLVLRLRVFWGFMSCFGAS